MLEAFFTGRGVLNLHNQNVCSCFPCIDMINSIISAQSIVYWSPWYESTKIALIIFYCEYFQPTASLFCNIWVITKWNSGHQNNDANVKYDPFYMFDINGVKVIAKVILNF